LSRLKVLVTQPRMALGALFTVALATAAVVGSGADFSASSANPANEFTTGTLKLSSTSSGALISATNLRPGDTQTGTVDIRNIGSLRGKFAVRLDNLADSGSVKPLSEQLQLTVRDCGAFADPDSGPAPACGDEAAFFNGPLNTFGSAARTLSTSYASQEKHRYQLELKLPNAAGDDYQGGAAKFDLTWLATS